MSKKGRWLVISSILLSTLLQISPAIAVNYTVTYNANPGYVGALSNSTNGVAQAGITTGDTPTAQSIVAGAYVTVQGQGTMARQGFTFAGWSTAQNGNGTLYAPGAQFQVNGDITLYAKWTVPLAARLIGNGGSMKQVTNPNSVTNGGYCLAAGVRGITSDGTYIYLRPSTYPGYICKTTPEGVVVSVHAVSNYLTTAFSTVGPDSLALVYGNGCLFIRKDTGTTFNSLYCIDITNWTLNNITLPGSYPMPTGGTWLYGNFIQFPDGRIGAVGTSVASSSWTGGEGNGAGQCPKGMWCKNLRLYNVSGTGSGVTTTYSTDFILADNALSDSTTWPSDDHGIATDGTYLYQIRHARGYKVWALSSTGPSFLVFNGDANGLADTTPACGASTGITGTFCQITNPLTGTIGLTPPDFSNGTYLGRAHGLNQYLIGDYVATAVSGTTYTRFWLSDAVTPPPGPGNPDIVAPSFTSTDTFTVAENVATTFNAATIVVNESATLVIAAGLDGSQFTLVVIDTASAYIRFRAPPDYEGPTDTGGNNQYDITINATDSAGNTGVRQINIRVTNVNENANIGTPTVSGNIYKGIQISITAVVNAPGKVRFFMDGKRVAGCLSVSTSGSYPNYSAVCNWKPTSMARHTVTAYLTPSDNTFTGGSSQVLTVWVLKRTTNR